MALSNQLRKKVTAEQVSMTGTGASRGAKLWVKSLTYPDMEPGRENGWSAFSFAG